MRRQSRGGNWYTVQERTIQRKYGHLLYRIVFDSGYETLVTAIDLHRNKIRDRGYIRFHGQNLPGSRFKNYTHHPLYSKWTGILDRTLVPQRPKYYEDVTLCKRWLSFDSFVEDAVKLPGYDPDRMAELTIDKDMFGSRVGRREYAPDTCCWLTPAEQVIYRRRLAKTKAPQCPYRGVHYTDGFWLARVQIDGERDLLDCARDPLWAALQILTRYPSYYNQEERCRVETDARKAGMEQLLPKPKRIA